MLSESDGELLRSIVAAKPNTILNFPEEGVLILQNYTGGTVSTFSEWGPTNELRLNPHFLAPGGYIYSTFPVKLGSYAFWSGTSMATPYLAGVAALYLSVKGPTDPLKLRDMLAATASPRDWNDGVSTTVGLKAPVAQQGAGLVDAYKLLKSTPVFNPGFLELNVRPSRIF